MEQFEYRKLLLRELRKRRVKIEKIWRWLKKNQSDPLARQIEVKLGLLIDPTAFTIPGRLRTLGYPKAEIEEAEAKAQIQLIESANGIMAIAEILNLLPKPELVPQPEVGNEVESYKSQTN